MPRFCANLTWLWQDLPLLERIPAAAAAGFQGVEILRPYDEPAPQVAEAARLAGVPVVLINCPPPNWTGGEPGWAAVPGGEERFRKDFLRSVKFARVLGAGHVHVMAGVAEGAAARETFVRNLRWAAAEVPEQSLTVEPLNPWDMPGYFLNDYLQGLEIVEEVGAPNLRLQFDAYHVGRIHGDIPGMWARCAAHVVHVQVAGVPDRHEPEGAEWAEFFAMLDEGGYSGWVSAEYGPKAGTEAGLGWLRAAMGR